MRISDWSSDVCSSDLRGREADNQHRGPDIVDILREIDRHDAAGTKEHRDLAREIGRVAGLDESRRQPAAGDAAEVGYQIDGGERQAEALEVQIGRASCRERVCQYV